MTKQDEAFLNLFLAIIEENGYYDNLREHFMGTKGYNLADLASDLYARYEKTVPDGMSVYYYLDSLEDSLTELKQLGDDLNEITCVQDLIDIIYDKMWWKE